MYPRMFVFVVIPPVVIRQQIVLDRGGNPPVEIGPLLIAPPVDVPCG